MSSELLENQPGFDELMNERNGSLFVYQNAPDEIKSGTFTQWRDYMSTLPMGAFGSLPSNDDVRNGNVP